MKSNLVQSNVLPMLSPDSNYTKILERFVRGMDATDLTKQLYKKRMEYFFAWMTDEQILKPERDHVLEYKRQLKSRGLQANSIGSYLVAIRSFFEWTNNQGIYPNIAAWSSPQSPRFANRKPNFNRKEFAMNALESVLIQFKIQLFSGKVTISFKEGGSQTPRKEWDHFFWNWSWNSSPKACGRKSSTRLVWPEITKGFVGAAGNLYQAINSTRRVVAWILAVNPACRRRNAKSTSEKSSVLKMFGDDSAKH